ncbi:HD domain-containing phosphohydrolase [Niveibacterium sp. SC-1]|uniref:HD domain-containing phosphohydrolase n=1 Tax=Niveibacterium sp. SC-1 TaxID=3135646 RepID=UPI00311F521A
MKVIIIDDTPVNLALMQALISRVDGCETEAFADPQAGLERALTGAPDLLIVDFMMPGMDGLELISRFRAVHAEDVPVLMVTAAHEKEIRYQALESGATDFLSKPIDKHEFIPRVRNMLALRRHAVALGNRAEELAEAVRIATADIHEREHETVIKLARAAEFRDPETGAHIQRMAHFSCLIGRRLGLDAEFLEHLLDAAPMHDVGKLGTPDAILLKPGRLTPEEFEVMKQHATIGHEILKDSASPVLRLAAEIAHSHHEHFDGSGYPRGLAGEDIPLSGRIVAIADVFDALTSERPYKSAWSLEDTRAHLELGRGRHFDPACLDAFLGAWIEVLEIRHRFAD